MTAAEVIDIQTPLVPGATFDVGASVDFAAVYVPAEHIVATCAALRDHLNFEVLVEVTAADYLPRNPRYEVVSMAPARIGTLRRSP